MKREREREEKNVNASALVSAPLDEMDARTLSTLESGYNATHAN